MGSKAAVPVILGLGAGILALVLLTRKAEAASPPEIPVAEVPTVDEVMAAQSVAELNAWYNLIGELYIIGKIGTAEYMTLYDAYVARFNELTGGS